MRKPEIKFETVSKLLECIEGELEDKGNYMFFDNYRLNCSKDMPIGIWDDEIEEFYREVSIDQPELWNSLQQMKPDPRNYHEKFGSDMKPHEMQEIHDGAYYEWFDDLQLFLRFFAGAMFTATLMAWEIESENAMEV